MKRNPVIPYGIIAVIGILAIVIVAGMGVGQRDAIQAEQDGEATEEKGGEEAAASDDPEAIYESNCLSCHGEDLSGGMGPDISKAGADHDADELVNIIQNGIGDMPPTQVGDEEASVLAEWLSEKK
ncbi:cytochrome c [Cerasibacillus terrae]|uniref:Cytochrome c n=1 Tax=Cerasibacillus terrae TaxID=2498845 RepID=A0A5C8P302_9BACI|nr:cytochrome c [Cerasibacillus terrae]TXL67995.1 cytochrome c [Cerasibacillus terrae]